MSKAKPFDIPKKMVWEAFQSVKANQGAAGVDGQSIQDFEVRLAGNLYKLWNRLSSGSYMPPPVRRVDIPKANGGTRPLGIPTVADRVAQEVVRRTLEPVLEPLFHQDSYGYRPGRSAIDAVRAARERCWRYDWIIDLDIKGFFDSIDWELLLRSVRKHAPNRWVVLYIERWLKAPAMGEDGILVPREQGTPQGGVISPLLANLFLHYAFDLWMHRTFPGVPFERYADDAICHCRSEAEALALRQALDRRFAECRLVLHAEKTKIVYCKDTNRRRQHPIIHFDFLGYQFRPRGAKWRDGLYGTSFLPGASPKALKAIRQAIRRWSLQTRSDKALDDLARMFNPYIRGWINYYSHFYKSALYPTLRRIDVFLISMGTPEVQAISAAAASRARLAGTGGPVFAGPVRSLVSFVWTKAERWEPYELRGSRTVLGARGGEIPPRDSLAAVPSGGDLRPRRCGTREVDTSGLGGGDERVAGALA